MSDEFIRIATQEIKDEVAAITKILSSCSSDTDIFKNAVKIEKHIHKIKGLAPMMSQNEIGEIAALNDDLLKHIMDGNELTEIYSIMSQSASFMKNKMNGIDSDVRELKQKIRTNYSKILD